MCLARVKTESTIKTKKMFARSVIRLAAKERADVHPALKKVMFLFFTFLFSKILISGGKSFIMLMVK